MRQRRSKLCVAEIIISLLISVTFYCLVKSLCNNILAKMEEQNKLLLIDNDFVKKDWHDREAMEADRRRVGLGEQGKPAKLPEKDKEEEKRIFRQNGFSGLLSDRISLNRSVPDIRYKGCDNKTYISRLPAVSIVIPFYNEHWSTLLRTVYSLLNRSPSELIHEIILVDDFSDKDFLGEKLDKFVAGNLPKVKIIRLDERSGLITARLAGAKEAVAEVLIFLDSHVEANYNWLPPLLEPITLNWRTCVCPFIDIIDYNNFEYRTQDEGCRGGFDWDFFYKRLPLQLDDLKDRTKPFRNPVMAGGLFAISTNFFWELGGYDEGLDIWGGEQYELSFKIWMCGGEMFDAPCSRVGHVYRGPMDSKNARSKDVVHTNYKRVADVWMDEYAKYIYDRNSVYKSIDAGDLSKQKALRKSLQCKSFKWFLEEIAFDLIARYPMTEPPPTYGHGAIQSLANEKFCLDTFSRGELHEIGLNWCGNDLENPEYTQNWTLSWRKDLRTHNSLCLDVSTSTNNSKVVLFACHGDQGNQLWYYDLQNKWFLSRTDGRCLEADLKHRIIYVNICDKSNKNMRWKFAFVNETALNTFHKIHLSYNDG